MFRVGRSKATVGDSSVDEEDTREESVSSGITGRNSNVEFRKRPFPVQHQRALKAQPRVFS